MKGDIFLVIKPKIPRADRVRFTTVDPHKTKLHACCDCWCEYVVDRWIYKVRLYKATSVELLEKRFRREGDWVVYVEEPYLYRNFRTAKVLSMAVGEVKLAVEANKQVFTLLNPAKWTAWSGLKHEMYALVVSTELRRKVDEDLAAAYLMACYVLEGGKESTP